MKKLLFRIPFFQNIRVQAFRDAQRDILETMADDLDQKAEELAKKKLAELLSIVDEKSVIAVDSRTKTLYIGGEQASPERIANLRAEADALRQFDLWKILHETPKRLAEKAMFEDDGKIETNLLKGRAILYTLATQKKVLEMLSTRVSTS